MQFTFKPSSLKQAAFLQSNAYITVFGGSAGSGKTFQGLLRFLRWVHDPEFVGYVIRKNASDLKGSGGAFDLAKKMFKAFDKRVRITKQPMRITFPHPDDAREDGASIFFTGLDGQVGQDSLQGKEITAAMVDEATHLTESDIWWISSRLRTNASGVEPNLWLTCNPDPDSFLLPMIEWYLYPKGTYVDGKLVEGRPDPEKNGLIRYYLMVDEKLVWSDNEQELYDKYSDVIYADPLSPDLPQSFKFIGATCKDNPLMLQANPRYESNLLKMPRIKRERLYYGNWYAREEESGYYKRDWTPTIANMPDDVVRRVRCWDLASSIPCEAYPNPDWTVGVLLAKTKSGFYIVEDVQRFRKRAGENIQEIIRIAKEDNSLYGKVECFLPEDPSAGKTAKIYHAQEFNKAGLVVKFIKVLASKSKLQRFEPFTASAENGLVMIFKDAWNDTYFSELEAFDGSRRSARKDDQVDATADAFNKLTSTKELPKISARKLRMAA